jgi:DNA-binding transcriptional MerR regulator
MTTNDSAENAMLTNRKTYFSIREVAEQTALEPHVLRYWESEFAQLRPKKNRAGNRAYREKDIELILFIKHLLYEEQFTIPGAKKKLSETKTHDSAAPEAAAQEPVAQQPAVSSLETIQNLKKVLGILLE